VPRACDSCHGTGQHTTTQQKKGISLHQVTLCPHCGGRGQIIDQPCPKCRGNREIEQPEELAVKIPPGIEEGMSLRIPGRGAPSPTPHGTPGDLFIVVHTAPDPRFARRGDQLWCTQSIGAVDATLGTTLRVPTLGGEVDLKIPPGTQPDTVLRVRGQGLPRFGGGKRGDLYVAIRLRVPEKLSSTERKLFEQLRALQTQHRKGA
jgi:molecular chaperone DnaJ